jgi:hypothetical protein
MDIFVFEGMERERERDESFALNVARKIEGNRGVFIRLSNRELTF